jgi:hypothetical protein
MISDLDSGVRLQVVGFRRSPGRPIGTSPRPPLPTSGGDSFRPSVIARPILVALPALVQTICKRTTRTSAV